jgi:hypothetical protein
MLQHEPELGEEVAGRAVVLDFKTRVRCRGCGARGRTVSIKWRRGTS